MAERAFCDAVMAILAAGGGEEELVADKDIGSPQSPFTRALKRWHPHFDIVQAVPMFSN
jgi:hypothetical protein